MIWKRPGDEAVSEVVGNLLILVITVALFSVVLSFVYQIPGPEATIQADVVPMLERTSAVDGTLHLQHTGGEPLREGETYILVSIDDTPQEFKISDGLGGKTVMEPGDTWSMDFLGTISTSAKIDVKIVDRTSNSLLFYTVVQRGVSSGGTHPPIIAYAWVDTTVPGLDVLPNNAYTTWRIYAVCKDIDGDLPPTGSVTASITSTDLGDGTARVSSFAGGPTAMSDNRGDGVFMSGLLKVATTVLPGDYSFTVTAMDDAGHIATATVRVTVSTAQSSIRMASTDEAPTILKSGDTNQVFLKLEFLANGESINVNQIRVTKLGTIADTKVWIYCYWDKDRDGSLNFGTDYLMPGWGNPSGGLHQRDFVGSPLFTAIEDEPTYVWVVLTVAAGTEGSSVGVRIDAQAAVTCVGVSTPIRILPIGSFPMDSSVLTIKGVFKLYGYNRHPARILTNTNNVPMIELLYQATGESVRVHDINLTLLGNVPHDQVTVYLKDEWNNVLTPNLPFDASRRCEIHDAGGWLIDEAWPDRQIYVFVNVLGSNGETIGVQVDDDTETYAITEVSLNGINPQLPQYGVGVGVIPPGPQISTLASSGVVTLDREYPSVVVVRSGSYHFAIRWLFRCYGEPIEFRSFKVTLEGAIPYDQFTNVRIRVYSSSPAGPVYDNSLPFEATNTVTFEHAVPGTPIFVQPLDPTSFYGWVRVDLYLYFDHGLEGQIYRAGIAAAADVHVHGQITGSHLILQPYAAGDIPAWSRWRAVNGQLYAHGTSLIPDPLVDSSQNVPVLKVTLNAEGQDVYINSFTIRKLGIVAMNLVTVRIYHDVNNDTYNRLNADDVELDPTRAGNFILNAITFQPNEWVTVGTDYSIVVVFSLNLGTAGWNLGASVNAGEIGTVTNDPFAYVFPAYPNACLNVARNPPMVMVSNTVPIQDRGTLDVAFEDLSPPAPVETGVYSWMKLSFWAEGEKVDVNRIKFSATNGSGNEPADWSKIRIGLFHDVNNNSVWDIGTDTAIDNKWFDAFGEADFLASPLFAVSQRVTYNLLVVINPGVGSSGNFSLNITTEFNLQAKGQVSGLSVTPNAMFPLECIEREIT